MNITGYLAFGYMGIGLVLGSRCMYLYQLLLRYIDKQYPDKGKIIRSYEGHWYPWSVGQKTLRELVKKEGGSDNELIYRRKKVKQNNMYFLAWCILFILIFGAYIFLTIVS